MNPQKVTVPEILKRKQGGKKIAMLTAYDYPFARILDDAGVDVLLVGDTLGMVVQGLDTTLPVTVDEIIYHLKMVARARTRALVVGDLPFLSYQVSTEEALRNAGRMMKEGGAEAVKLEGGIQVAATIAALTAVDIPVMAHIGLTPQSVHRMGGHKVQGKKHGRMAGGRERLLDDAVAVEEAGAFALVLEGIPLDLAAEITERVSIPTIGIGAGVGCDGQVLVLHDLLGLFDKFAPKFSKRYVNLKEIVAGAVRQYIDEVQHGEFPTDAHSFHSPKIVEPPARSAG